MLYVGEEVLASLVLLLLARTIRRFAGAWPVTRQVLVALTILLTVTGAALVVAHIFSGAPHHPQSQAVTSYLAGLAACVAVLGVPLYLRAYGSGPRVLALLTRVGLASPRPADSQAPGRSGLLALAALSAMAWTALYALLFGLFIAVTANILNGLAGDTTPFDAKPVVLGLGVAAFSLAILAASVVGLRQITASERSRRVGGGTPRATRRGLLGLLQCVAAVGLGLSAVTAVALATASTVPSQRFKMLQADGVLRCHPAGVGRLQSDYADSAGRTKDNIFGPAETRVSREFSLNGAHAAAVKTAMKRCAKAKGWQVEPSAVDLGPQGSKTFPDGWKADLFIGDYYYTPTGADQADVRVGISVDIVTDSG